ncbi:hypothetical protein [Cohnella silvisoli]|uniref:Phosphoribosylformylglycinamidine synthase, purS protein n=1 Tax=Cohnella silvisoli TaxID=2873699 RepID=A0ABV1KSJ5_9BACL|nr:hypothetical protein [Cohnella silvisoli]MCD9024510.1 hypothetical protein [Cohnella silvisoli]
MIQAALMFQFPDESQARLAGETLEDLGYEPQLHEGGRLHIHVEDEDLTSALEIVQCYAGQLMEHAPAEVVHVTDIAYGMDDIPIPAHTVNEDWEEAYQVADSDNAERKPSFSTDDGSYDHFQAT